MDHNYQYIEKPDYLPGVVWSIYQEEWGDQHCFNGSGKKAVMYCRDLLFGKLSKPMFSTMLSKHGGIATRWDDETWSIWLHCATMATVQVEQKDRAELAKRRNLVLAQIAEKSRELCLLMDEAHALCLAGLNMPDGAMGFGGDASGQPVSETHGELMRCIQSGSASDLSGIRQWLAPPRTLRAALHGLSHDEGMALVASWWRDSDSRLATVSNREARLRYAMSFLDLIDKHDIAVSDNVLAYQSAAIYGITGDETGEGFSKLKDSISQARKARNRKRKSE